MSIDQDKFIAIVSGRRRDAKAVFARSLLRVASLGYGLVVRIRSLLYNRRILTTHSAGVPVLCVGNLTTGGTGKTPLVVWLCRHICEKGFACAILTRGYKTQTGELSDEPALLAAQCPYVPVVVNPDRVAGTAEAIRAHKAQALVMDDGFQHRRLARDLDIVAVDATNPFGYGRVLPAGLLREPMAGLKRAHAVVLTRCDQVSGEALSRIEDEIRRINRNLVIARSVHAPVTIRTAQGTEIPFDRIRGQRIFAFCGIGNPQAFFRTIDQLGATISGSRVFDDHYRYTSQDLRTLQEQARNENATLILTTQKDWTKASKAETAGNGPALAYLAIDLRFTAGAESLRALIDRVLDGRIPPAE